MTQNMPETRESWRDYFVRQAAIEAGRMTEKGEDARDLGEGLVLDYTRRTGFRLHFVGSRTPRRIGRYAAVMLLAGNLALEEAWRHGKA